MTKIETGLALFLMATMSVVTLAGGPVVPIVPSGNDPMPSLLCPPFFSIYLPWCPDYMEEPTEPPRDETVELLPLPPGWPDPTEPEPPTCPEE